MHGLLLRKFRQFAALVARDLPWSELAVRAAVPDRAYSAEDVYADEEFHALMAALSDHHRLAREEMLELFGAYLAPEFVHMSLAWNLSQSHWRTMDYVVHVQGALHAGIARLVPGVSPPRLMSIRYTPRKALIIYFSQRHLCPMAKGIILGLAKFFKENYTVILKERQCLITGAKECWIYVMRGE